MVYVIILLSVTVVAVVAIAAGMYVKARAAADDVIRIGENLSEMRSDADRYRSEAERLRVVNERLVADVRHWQGESERLRGDEDRFKVLAATVLADSRRSMVADADERMRLLLDPLRENIDAFRRSLDERSAHDASERGALREKIDELQRLNVTLGEEARTLANALKNNKGNAQGNWGEMILKRLLEQAGFQEGREFVTQRNVKDEEGKDLRPDVVINFPDRGCVVIDSKASLTDYINYCGAENELDRKAAGSGHVESVRTHVRELAVKNYDDLVGGKRKLDFVMMFIPNEGAYLAAMQLEPQLWQEAYDKHVLIISPTHLFSVLKLVQQLWRHDAQTRYAVRIAEEAGKMYDKFYNFVGDMKSLKRAIDDVSEAYAQAFNKLKSGKGNLVKKASDLYDMGIKAKKPRLIPEDGEDDGGDDGREEAIEGEA